MRIELRLNDKNEWVKIFDPRDCTIFVPAEPLPAVGQEVRCDLSVGEAGPRIILRGRVISHGKDGGNPLAVVALGPEEREKINYLNGFVRGGLLNLREKRRLPIRLDVTYGGVDGPCDSYTRDINEVGVFVVTEDPLPEQSEIHLLITFPQHTEPVSVIGLVSHTVVVEDEDVPGMGILFRFADGQAEQFKRSIDELERRFLNAELPEGLLV